MKTVARTVCDPNCHANPKCGIAATIEDDRIIAVTAADYPLDDFKNRICLMGRARLDYQYHADRLRTPLKRVGERGGDEWQAISWQEAIELFTENHRHTAQQYGEKSVMLTQISGASGLLTRGAMSRYAALTGATVMAPGGIDYGLPRGLEYMFGLPASAYFLPGGHSMTDAVNSDVVLLWGSNMAITRSVDHAPLKTARAGGTRLICIDPTNSETAALCDQWISLRPGSDGALAWSMVNWIIERGLYNKDFLLAHTDMPLLVNRETGLLLRESDLRQDGGDQAMVCTVTGGEPIPMDGATAAVLDVSTTAMGVNGETLEIATVFTLVREESQTYAPARAAAITEVEEETIKNLAETYAGASPGAIRMGFGLDRWYHSDSTARIIATLASLTGNIGVRGGGVSVNSGGRFAPVQARSFYAPDGKVAGAISMMDADRCVREGNPYSIKMECIALGNPFNQVKPDRKRVLSEYIAKLDFICVIDHFMTETARHADLVLPACTIFEKTDMVIDSFVQLQQAVVEPEGEAKSDFDIFRLLGTAMGHGEYFDKSAEEYLSAMLDASTDPLVKDLTWERLHQEKVVYPWPDTDPYVGFADRKFPTATGRVESYTETLRDSGSALPVYREPIEASPKNELFEKYPLVLLSAHSRYRIHSTFANMPLTQQKEPVPVMRVSAADAASRSIADGDTVRVFNDRGLMKIVCQVDKRIRPGTVLVSEGHWVEQFIEGDPYILTHDRFNPTAENYAHYDVLVEVEAEYLGSE